MFDYEELHYVLLLYHFGIIKELPNFSADIKKVLEEHNYGR